MLVPLTVATAVKSEGFWFGVSSDLNLLTYVSAADGHLVWVAERPAAAEDEP
jgi:hypothetical protein